VSTGRRLGGNGFFGALSTTEAGIIKWQRTWRGQATSLSLVKPNAADMHPASSWIFAQTGTPIPTTPIPVPSEDPALRIRFQTTSASPSSGRPRWARQIRNWAQTQAQTQKTSQRIGRSGSDAICMALAWSGPLWGPDESGYQSEYTETRSEVFVLPKPIYSSTIKIPRAEKVGSFVLDFPSNLNENIKSEGKVIQRFKTN